MASGDILVGRRLPVGRHEGRPTIPWEDFQPGDYCGPVIGWTGDKPAVFFLKPNARDEDAPVAARSVQHVCSPPHVFTEQPDGSLEIRESISNYKIGAGGERGAEPDGWHGYLDAGHVWRQV